MVSTDKKNGDAGMPPRIRWTDYMMLFFGVGLSLWFADLMGVHADVNASWSRFRQAFVRELPALLFLPLGMQIFWPIFFLEQKLLGRKQPLTMGEWLMGLVWLLTFFLVGWIIWQATGNIPEGISSSGFRQNLVLGYMLTVLTLGALALVLLVFDLVRRRPQPWTHTLTLALLVWPAVPLLCMWLAGIRLR